MLRYDEVNCISKCEAVTMLLRYLCARFNNIFSSIFPVMVPKYYVGTLEVLLIVVLTMTIAYNLLLLGPD